MPKPDVALHPLVMMRTFSARLRARGRSLTGGLASAPRTESPTSSRAGSRLARLRPTRAQLASARGDTLIEVLISALLVGLIVVGTFSGLDSTTKATALQRARSQADALAEQDEERLHSLPLNSLVALETSPKTNPITVGHTTYSVESHTAYIADTTATESCTSISAEANYLKTTSKVTWTSLGNGKPVEETSVISPPPGANMIVQVTESGTALSKATVTVTELTPKSWTHTLETSIKGCVIFALPEGGEYAINVHKTGYVTPNGYPNTDEDEKDTQKVYIPAETTSKEGYSLGYAGKIRVNFSPNEGETFTIFNTGITSFKKLGNAPHQASLAWFGTENTYASQVETPTELYPFTTHYIVYAGECEADKPPAITPENEVLVPREGKGETTLTLPQLKLKVYSGTTKTGSLVSEFSGSTTDTGCGTKRSFTTTFGTLPHPGLPYGTYSLCVSGKAGSPSEPHRWVETIHITGASGVEDSIPLGSGTKSSEPC
jgi:Tfp pilus assembly protein PilV